MINKCTSSRCSKLPISLSEIQRRSKNWVSAAFSPTSYSKTIALVTKLSSVQAPSVSLKSFTKMLQLSRWITAWNDNKMLPRRTYRLSYEKSKCMIRSAQTGRNSISASKTKPTPKSLPSLTTAAAKIARVERPHSESRYMIHLRGKTGASLSSVPAQRDTILGGHGVLAIFTLIFTMRVCRSSLSW